MSLKKSEFEEELKHRDMHPVMQLDELGWLSLATVYMQSKALIPRTTKTGLLTNYWWQCRTGMLTLEDFQVTMNRFGDQPFFEDKALLSLFGNTLDAWVVMRIQDEMQSMRQRPLLKDETSYPAP